MLEKLRSRHPIDVPAEKWHVSWGLLLVLGGIAGLFVLLPLGLSILPAAQDALGGTFSVPVAIALSFGTLVLVVLLAAARGKRGHGRR